ncbi:TadE/TadG family type IV pilus assembly protein [Amphiplicatus metriothermophilus]|uniref:TadE-like protein n=1 Tax=Amphiplicatus metriothermophilus TaxID=1519374 RepID=A0A239PJR8_9PROT|nr:TadE/TadG family type IV pilus assembly protein [Amphiplicatus metriothermophilus]MBB5517620.1 Flp pilus assembly protein TadG [Amphiplicatus metriothermophilus]SNT68046.1 TadE-like protein [Amphiplicatus metriothermophilus]
MRRLRARRFAKSKKGATAVEFALVSPLIFAAVLGTFEVGRALYERNRVSAACAAGARAVTINGAAAESAIEAAVRAKYHDAEQEDVAIDLTDETISGAAFKRIEVRYEHDLLIKFGKGVSGFTFTAVRYAPATS